MVNVMQQVGGALGLSILVTVFGTATRAAASHLSAAQAVASAESIRVHGMSASFTTAAIFDALALLIVIIAVRFRPAPATRD
jgi:uncharacterized membrane protein